MSTVKAYVCPASITLERPLVARGKKLDLFIGASFNDEWQQVEEAAQKKATAILLPQEHRLIFKLEKRRGKAVTLTGPFSLDKKESAALLKSLKKSLGCGGTFKDGWMELQGDLRLKLQPLLHEHHFSLK